MKDYPRLTEMGVIHPNEISHYSVNSIDYTDFLRIVYERPKGSLLPVSRSYRFPRVQRTHKTKADAVDGEVVMERSPIFREVLVELQTLRGAKDRKRDIAAEMLDELQQLEEEFAMRSEYLKVLIDKMRTS